MKKWPLALATAVILTAGTAIAIPAISASTEKIISACVSKKTGILRIANKCKSSERKLTWNALGRQGEQGLPGSSGLPGLPGLPGPSGGSPLSLAGNCYQLLNQAESLGYLWTVPENLSFFEQRTGCKVREIDLNPNSQIQNFYSATAQPRVLSQRIVSIQGGGGEGEEGDPYFQLGARAVYEVSVSKPVGQELCSSGGDSWRVFRSPVNSKTYAVGSTYGNQRGMTTDISIGSGEIASSIKESEEGWKQFDDDGNLIDSAYQAASEDGELVVDFRAVPQYMPLGSTYSIKIKSVRWKGQLLPTSDYQVAGDGGLLAGLVHEEDEAGFAAVYTLTANEIERGHSNLTFTFATYELGQNSVSFNVAIGVKGCQGAPYINSEQGFDVYSNLYRVRETSPLPDFWEGVNGNFEETIGWVKYRWFELDPNDWPSSDDN